MKKITYLLKAIRPGALKVSIEQALKEDLSYTNAHKDLQIFNVLLFRKSIALAKSEADFRPHAKVQTSAQERINTTLSNNSTCTGTARMATQKAKNLCRGFMTAKGYRRGDFCAYKHEKKAIYTAPAKLYRYFLDGRQLQERWCLQI